MWSSHLVVVVPVRGWLPPPRSSADILSGGGSGSGSGSGSSSGHKHSHKSKKKSSSKSSKVQCCLVASVAAGLRRGGWLQGTRSSSSPAVAQPVRRAPPSWPCALTRAGCGPAVRAGRAEPGQQQAPTRQLPPVAAVSCPTDKAAESSGTDSDEEFDSFVAQPAKAVRRLFARCTRRHRRLAGERCAAVRRAAARLLGYSCLAQGLWPAAQLLRADPRLRQYETRGGFGSDDLQRPAGAAEVHGADVGAVVVALTAASRSPPRPRTSSSPASVLAGTS